MPGTSPSSWRLVGSLRSLLIAGVLVLITAASARADGWKIQLQGAKALGLGYAGRALAEDASVVWFNPAGMTSLATTDPACQPAAAAPAARPASCRSLWLTLGGAVVPFGLDYTDRGSISVLGQGLSGPTTRDGGLTGAIPFFYAVKSLSHALAIGGGLNAPHGLSDDYGEAWVGRYHATKSELKVVNLDGVVAYQIHPRLSVAGGIDIQHGSATLANMIDFGSYAAVLLLPLTPQGSDGRIELQASDWAVGYDLSAAWHVGSGVRVASTFRSQITHRLEGDATFTVPASASFFRATGAFADTGAATSLPMPREWSGSVAYDVNRTWTIVGDVTWTDWSQFSGLTVAFDNPVQAPLTQNASYEDSVRVAGGVVYRTSRRWTFRAGALYEDSPVPDATRTPRLPEVNNAGLSAGTSYRLSGRWDVDLGWSHLIPHDAPIGLVDPTAGVLSGKVRWTTDAVAFGLNARF